MSLSGFIAARIGGYALRRRRTRFSAEQKLRGSVWQLELGSVEAWGGAGEGRCAESGEGVGGDGSPGGEVLGFEEDDADIRACGRGDLGSRCVGGGDGELE